MLRVFKFACALIFCGSLGSLPCHAGEDCFGTLRNGLVKGGYSGDLDCSDIKVNLKEVGTLIAGPNSYTIYDFRYTTIPSPSGTAHGGQRVWVFSADGLYVGQYVLSPPPYRSIRISGNTLTLDVPAGHGEKVVFSDGSPPKQSFVDDDIVPLEK